MAKVNAPMGEVTLVMSDIEGSSAMWNAFGETTREALAIHDEIMRTALADLGGYEVQTAGDSFFVAFQDAQAALAYCLLTQRRLATATWPPAFRDEAVRVRMGAHSGNPWIRSDPTTGRMDYGGPDTNITSRISGAAHGGQVLLSQAMHERVKDAKAAFRCLGFHALRGLQTPMQIWQAGDDDASFPAIRTIAARRTNVLPRSDAFFGREVELADLAHLLANGTRLISVIGPGGTGKTRLCETLVTRELGRFEAGAWWVDLTGAEDLEGVHAAMAASLDVPAAAGDTGALIGRTLAARGPMLVVLDNFEQVAGHATATVGAWLGQAPHVRFIVTTRTRLKVKGERLYDLHPLTRETALRLFVDRAQAVNPSFVLRREERALAVDIIEELERVSLAIELAAARTRIFTLAQLKRRLAARFRVLRDDNPEVSDRQATLRGAIDWSWRLLKPAEQLTLAQCSVFRDGFTLTAAESVLDLQACPDEPWPDEVLQALIDHSLLLVTEPFAGHRRFRLMESIREFAAEELASEASIRVGGAAVTGPDQANAIRMRHARHFAALSDDEFTRSLHRSGGVARRKALNLEHHNLKAAFETARSAGDNTLAARCAVAASEIFGTKGPVDQGLARLKSAAELPNVKPAIGVLIAYWRGLLERFTGRVETARLHFETALIDAERLDMKRWLARTRTSLAILQREMGQLDKARGTFESAIELLQEVGDKSGEGVARCVLALVYSATGDVALAIEQNDRALQLADVCGDEVLVGRVNTHAGWLHELSGELEQARQNFAEGLRTAIAVEDRVGEALCLGQLGKLAVRMEDWPEAERVLLEALPLCDELLPVAAAAFRSSLAVVRAEQGLLKQAREEFDAAGAVLKQAHFAQYARHLVERAGVEIRHGDRSLAAGYLDEADALASGEVGTVDRNLVTQIAETKARLKRP